MIDSVFGNMNFSTGWKVNIEISLFGRVYPILLKARAYYEADGLTTAQEDAFSDCKHHMNERCKEIEALLQLHGGQSCMERYTPRTLLFEKDGGYALLCDDSCNPDDGIAVILAPEQKVMSQDDYL